MAKVIRGNKVKVHYTGSFEDGEVFDSSVGKEPFVFDAGMAQVVPGFDLAVVGMEEGEKKTVNLQPELAYGEKQDELIAELKLDVLPENIKPEVGMALQVPSEDGGTIAVKIIEIKEDTFVIDGNYPLAGKTLIFEIELLEIVK